MPAVDARVVVDKAEKFEHSSNEQREFFSMEVLEDEDPVGEAVPPEGRVWAPIFKGRHWLEFEGAGFSCGT